MYLGSYSKDGVDKDKKIIVLTIKKMLKLLINKENEVKVLAASESIAQAFKVFKKKVKN